MKAQNGHYIDVSKYSVFMLDSKSGGVTSGCLCVFNICVKPFVSVKCYNCFQKNENRSSLFFISKSGRLVDHLTKVYTALKITRFGIGTSQRGAQLSLALSEKKIQTKNRHRLVTVSTFQNDVGFQK